jgi:DMSO/TMAO reductase YedYZ molybdopterin-dependent catalytic subunit
MPDDRKPSNADREIFDQMSRRTRRSFLAGGTALATAAVGYRFFDRSKPIGLLRRPLRAAEDFNGAFSEHVIGETALTPVYPASRALTNPRPNGPFGIRKDLDPTSWRLQLTGLDRPQQHPKYVEDVSSWNYDYAPSFAKAARKLDGESMHASDTMAGDNNKLAKPDAGTPTASGKGPVAPQPPLTLPPAPGLLLTMADIQSLPFVQQTTEFKCIEGWSELVSFGGVRFRDFIAAHPPLRNPDGSLPGYAAMATPDGAYFCGFEMASLLHPQTLLCFQMSGRDLTPAHGAPLRLAMPLKYGYKQIKQIARITYTNTKPEDYWANLGFDWHGGL